MSRRQKVRKAVRWARYFNRYGHIPDVLVASGYSRYLRTVEPWGYVRRQAKHRFMHGYANAEPATPGGTPSEPPEKGMS